MDSTGSEKAAPLIDEEWLQQWVAYGMLEIAMYLSKYDAFRRYCERRSSPVSGKPDVCRQSCGQRPSTGAGPRPKRDHPANLARALAGSPSWCSCADRIGDSP